ncbi:hypothetical protein [Candidatus Uabimicrobium sp. HlEnr_7]|uniref:hypothetical protein n=1 Tax=Candidatus Uabimicrobium helgolandensis TaxID=3095367 RepID=UPI003557474D
MKRACFMCLCLFGCSALMAQSGFESVIEFFKRINWQQAFVTLKGSRDLEIMCLSTLWGISTMLMLLGLFTNHLYIYSHSLFAIAGAVLGGVFSYNEYESSGYATQAAVYLLAGGVVILSNVFYLVLERVLNR